MSKILESSSEYQRKRKEEQAKSACPECGAIPLITSKKIVKLNIWGTKYKEVHTVRCDCGCLYEFEY